MKNFICSDIHGFHSIFRRDLQSAGFELDNPEHRIIICGDLFDRGPEAKELLDFLCKIPEERLVIVRGNHEDLLEDCLFQMEQRINISQHHWFNGTVDTIAQLSGYSKYDIPSQCYDIKIVKKCLKKYFKLISRAVDYFETDDFICVHGWIPLDTKDIYYIVNPDWRNADSKAWDKARWLNGMDMAHNGLIETKPIICGHWHCGYGNFHFHHLGSNEYEVCDIYFDKGIIALDSCVARTGKLNVYVVNS